MLRPTALSFPLRLMRLLAWVRRPEFLVFLPAITLAGFWLGGESVLLLLALGLPLMFALTAQADRDWREESWAKQDGGEGPSLRRALAMLDGFLPQLNETGQHSACLVVQFDGWEQLLERHGRSACADVLARTQDRLAGALRRGDLVAPLQGEGFAIILAPVKRLDLEALVQLCGRLQEAISAPISLGATQIYVTASIGFCIAGRSAEMTGPSLLEAAQLAADEAGRQGGGAIRAYAPEMASQLAMRDAMRDQIEAAFDNDEIRPQFQPQICTDTGKISGMEALARWHHPERGCLAPAEFLPAVESCHLTERLGEVMLFHALSALAEWDRRSLRVPCVSVNFAASELRNPRLPDRLKWELDRFELTADRLTIEILETVIAGSAQDVVVANIAALAAMGCGIDLDDFGTGHASITTIRRFAVRRLKIDRSFVTKVDQDREQQKMVAAILSLAERLGLQTLAEGVETAPEHAMLAQLGCGHVQGYAVARPMPLDEVTAWIARHNARPGQIPKIGVRSPR
ncbi:GGDEF domain-containing phosphodiesterase [Xinfangfangia sp. CPCC 101601]|uniref:GGDEF domain-containing phosphodiesterase n=1 Tax=Pseudogemmobacter lacusdianii TaxID=3069608 RepID=A0ABU0W0H3_9RHOB|nr:GGDEF domain-containing phosphodiesterase [Xinfangfangia sp. CPCC 101601]MDQ2067491.1 GGDEF domain-containing phosphodiesterase [Xinfangfangia sp. CPCC 101601]